MSSDRRRVTSENRASRRNPCPLCGGVKWPCLGFPSLDQPVEVVCGNVASDTWIEKLQGYRHRLDASTPRTTPLPVAPPSKREVPTAAPDVLDAVYRRARELSRPLDRQRELQFFTAPNRGMRPAQVDTRGYFPWLALLDEHAEGYRREGDSRWLLPARLVAEDGSKVYQVPGFGQRRDDGRPWAAGFDGIFLPALDPAGLIVGAQISLSEKAKRKTGTKYATLSAGKQMVGARASHLLHCSRPTGHGQAPVKEDLSARVWITEGILKADIASDLLGEIVLAGSGQTFVEEALAAYLNALGAVEVVVANDQDRPGSTAATNTARATEKVADQLVALGYRVSLAVWSHEEGKGIDDLLLAGGRPVLKSYEPKIELGQRRRPRLASKLERVDQPVDPRPVLSVEDIRLQYKDTLRDYLANKQGTSGKEVLLVRLEPGMGKTTGFEEVAKEYVDRDRFRSIVHFVPTHEVGHQLQNDGWHHVFGRTSDKAPAGRPCHQQELVRALAARGESPGSICKICPLKGACSSKVRTPNDPFFLSQFSDKRPLVRMPAAYLLTPDQVKECSYPGPLVFDDVDLDQLQISSTWITVQDLLDNLARANGEEDPEEGADVYLRPAVPFGELSRDFLRFLADKLVAKEQYPQGSDLVHALVQFAADTGRNPDQVVAAALTAREYNPLAGATSTDTLDAEQLGAKPVLTKLAQVLSFELAHRAAGNDTWNSRLSVGHPPGPNSKAHGLSFEVREVKPLPLDAFEGRPIIILDASATFDQVQRQFPDRKIRVFEPRAPLSEGVKITQHIDDNFSKTTLERDESARERAFEDVRSILARHPGQKVGAITHKSFADNHLREKFPDLTVKNFFNHRGQNDVADVNVWIVLGTPHPDEAALARATEALYWRDGSPLDHTVVWRDHVITDVNGLQYVVTRRHALDPRLQEQLAQRTSEEMLQALYRCRPHNLQAPQQGDFFRPLDQTGRTSIEIHVFSQEPLGLPVHVISERTAREPVALDQVVDAARKLVRTGGKATRRALEETTGASRRQVDNAVAWLRREHGEHWLETLAVEETPPRATSEPPAESFDEPLPVVVKKPQERPPLPLGPPAPEKPPAPTWKVVTGDIATASARPERAPPATGPPPTPAELWEALSEIL